MSQDTKQADLTPQNAIRVETVLSRFPVHRLVKRGGITIDIRESTPEGEMKTRWEVSHNSKYGQPGPLAYKVDSLIINRRIDESPKPLPRIIKLGTLRDICRVLGLNEGNATGDVKKALLQNASAFITAKRSFKGNDGVKRTAEIADTRYGVIFTGEKFPNGSKADAVYILLHDSYRDVLNAAPTRPLDYDYLKELSPGAQRFYDLLSYQMFAALTHERPRAKMLYSYYCARAPQIRYFDYEHVKKQMYKLHVPHRKSEYIAAIEMKATIDAEGQPDWEMLYTPGQKARAEFRASKRVNKFIGAKAETHSSPFSAPSHESLVDVTPNSDQSSPEVALLIGKLKEFGVAEIKARNLVKTKRKSVEEQLAAYSHRGSEQGGKNLAGWIVSAIENNYELPVAYVETKSRVAEAVKGKGKREAIECCTLCDASGFRMVKTENGRAAKKCSHDPVTEAKHPQV